MSDRLTLMAVHAHPDDEATTTGGVLARYSAEGLRTVLVTCTDGACGDGPGGVKPGQEGHDPQEVARIRFGELEASCRLLGIEDLELLNYADSGMMGWPQNDAPGSFWSTPVPKAAARLSVLMERYRPQVVVTYDANGFYGHPDHIQAHRITMAAVEATGIPDKVYFPTIPRSWADRFAQGLRAAGLAAPWGDDGPPAEWGTADEEIAAWLDVTAFATQKFEALAAHASQSENIFFLRMGLELFTEQMGREVFVRAVDNTGAARPEDDLFAGLR